MVRRKRRTQHAKSAAASEPAASEEAARVAEDAAAGEPAPVDVEAADGPVVDQAATEEAVQRLTAEAEELRDRHLRLAAEYDNFRKRTARERAELSARAQAALVGNVLEALDDLGRVAHLDPERATATDVIAGVELVERKLMRELEVAGLVRVGAEGDRFDPNHHEAVGAEPAPSPEAEGTVATVLQPGYRFGAALVRPARVRVYMASEPSSDGSGDAA